MPIHIDRINMSNFTTAALARQPATGMIGKLQSAFAIGKVRWTMLAMVFFATTLNYIDRAALGIMQPVLAKAMSWTAQDYANINFWFQAGYAIGYVLQGRLIDQIGVKRGFALAVLVWSVAAAAHGMVATVIGFMACRFALGLAEAGNYPSCIKTIRQWFPVGERAIATGVFNAGTNVGAMVTPLLVPFIMAVWGWQAAFFAIGAVGLVWLAFWIITYFNPEQHPGVTRSELDYIQQGHEAAAPKVSMAKVLRLRATWSYAVGNALSAPVFWFYLYWLPPYLNKQYNLGISVVQMGLPLIVIFLAADFGSIFGGVLSSSMIGRRMAPVTARLLSMFLCALCIVPIVFASSANGLWIAVFYISIAIAAHQAWTVNLWSLAMDTAPKNAVSSVFGVGGTCGAIGGMFMTQLVGYVLTVTDNNYAILFTMVPIAYFAALAWVFFVAPRKAEVTA
jgi:MFS transporter, ACS family, hexuronate transporter